MCCSFTKSLGCPPGPNRCFSLEKCPTHEVPCTYYSINKTQFPRSVDLKKDWESNLLNAIASHTQSHYYYRYTAAREIAQLTCAHSSFQSLCVFDISRSPRSLERRPWPSGSLQRFPSVTVLFCHPDLGKLIVVGTTRDKNRRGGVINSGGVQ